MKLIVLLLTSISLLSLGACTHGPSKKHEKMHKKWKSMDKDGDGAISQKEFDTAHGEKFKAMDANKDGKITMDEKKAYMKAKCGCR